MPRHATRTASDHSKSRGQRAPANDLADSMTRGALCCKGTRHRGPPCAYFDGVHLRPAASALECAACTVTHAHRSRPQPSFCGTATGLCHTLPAPARRVHAMAMHVLATAVRVCHHWVR